MNMTKKWGWGIGVVLIIIVLIGLGDYGLKLYQQWGQQQYIHKLEALRAQYKNDTYGGATPEETLQMFIKAFKSGDIELASKYFIPEKQSEYLAKMKSWVKAGKREQVLKNLSYDKKTCYEYKGECELSRYDNTVDAWYTTSLIHNSDTKKWKLKNM
jgi:hypothetical protein